MTPVPAGSSALRELVYTGVRHGAGALVGFFVAFGAQKGFDIDASTSEALISALIGLSLVAYALAEKALKPVFEKFFGTAGVS